jgi:hypothetical protein
MQGDFFVRRKHGFEASLDGIKKKAGIDPAFRYHGSCAAGYGLQATGLRLKAQGGQGGIFILLFAVNPFLKVNRTFRNNGQQPLRIRSTSYDDALF